MRLPFSQKTPIGYIATHLIQVGSFVVVCHTVFCALVLLTAFLGIMMSIGRDVQRKLRETNENFSLSRNDAKLWNDLYDIVRFYASALSLLRNFHLFVTYF